MIEKDLKQMPEIQDIALKKKDHKITAKYTEEFCDGGGYRWYIFHELETNFRFRVFNNDELIIRPEETPLTVGRLYELHWSIHRAADGMIRQKVEISRDEGWFTTQEAAEKLKLEVSTIRAYISQNVFPDTLKIGNMRYIPQSAIEAWINDFDARDLRKKKPRTEWAAMRKNNAAARETLEKITDETQIDEMRSLVKSALDILCRSSLAS